ILHLGYSWIVLALLLKSMSDFGLVPAAVWQHALGTGAIATMILGVMTRVALGHTGRPLKLPGFAILIYIAISLAAIFRLLTGLSVLDYQIGLMISGATWTLAFVLFVLIYWPVLSQPRIDGRPG
ncbi:MAG: NnrS family protein, partial [Pseudohongiellaceae bacterium]